MKAFGIHLLFLISLILLSGCQSTDKKIVKPVKKYQPNWESLSQYEYPEWFQDAKFGIYFHWGPYSVPAYETEWYSHWMYVEDHPIRSHHEKTYGPLDQFGYKDFIPQFTGEHFNAVEWVDLFQKAGAKFTGPVAEHADGFAMWDSDLTKWDAKEMGPKRDIVGEMAKAVKEKDLKLILTYHRHWLYAWYPTWDQNTDAYDMEYNGLYGPKVPEGTFVMAEEKTSPLPSEYFNKDWLARLDELMNKYEPDILWFDNKMDIIDEQYRLDFLSRYYNKGIEWNKEVVCTYKFTDLKPGTAILDLERSRMREGKDFPWLTDDSIDWEAWCHIDSPRYKSVDRLVDFLVDVVSKNGSLLLNVTPTAQGEIPPPVRERLLKMGEWLKINGEAIYNTRPWKIFGEGPTAVVEGHLSEKANADNNSKDIRFTTKDDILYAITLGWPEEDIQIRNLNTSQFHLSPDKSKIELIGSTEKLVWQQNSNHLIIQKPTLKTGNHAYVFRITP